MIICHSAQEAKTAIEKPLWIVYKMAPCDAPGISSLHSDLMYDPEDTGDHAADVARRLRHVRTALGINDQRDFGEAANLEQSLYNRFETGKRLLTLQAAMKLCERYGLTLDYLYRGDPSGLPYKLHNDIRSLKKQRNS